MHCALLIIYGSGRHRCIAIICRQSCQHIRSSTMYKRTSRRNDFEHKPRSENRILEWRREGFLNDRDKTGRDLSCASAA